MGVFGDGLEGMKDRGGVDRDLPGGHLAFTTAILVGLVLHFCAWRLLV